MYGLRSITDLLDNLPVHHMARQPHVTSSETGILSKSNAPQFCVVPTEMFVGLAMQRYPLCVVPQNEKFYESICATCSPSPKPCGEFEKEVKETIKITRYKTPEGLINETKEVITVKSRKIHPSNKSPTEDTQTTHTCCSLSEKASEKSLVKFAPKRAQNNSSGGSTTCSSRPSGSSLDSNRSFSGASKKSSNKCCSASISGSSVPSKSSHASCGGEAVTKTCPRCEKTFTRPSNKNKDLKISVKNEGSCNFKVKSAEKDKETNNIFIIIQKNPGKQSTKQTCTGSEVEPKDSCCVLKTEKPKPPCNCPKPKETPKKHSCIDKPSTSNKSLDKCCKESKPAPKAAPKCNCNKQASKKQSRADKKPSNKSLTKCCKNPKKVTPKNSDTSCCSDQSKRAEYGKLPCEDDEDSKPQNPCCERENKVVIYIPNNKQKSQVQKKECDCGKSDERSNNLGKANDRNSGSCGEHDKKVIVLDFCDECMKHLQTGSLNDGCGTQPASTTTNRDSKCSKCSPNSGVVSDTKCIQVAHHNVCMCKQKKSAGCQTKPSDRFDVRPLSCLKKTKKNW